jgi:RND family efflux transporter MFP subunit
MKLPCLRGACLMLVVMFTRPAISEELWIPGYTRAVFDLNLALPVSGRVEVVAVRDGERVEAGAPLLNLDNRLETIEMERRRALWQSNAELNAAIARLPILTMQLRSARSIFSTNASISREEVQAKELAVIAAASDIEARRAAKEVERLDYEAAREALERRTLRAPITGRVVRILRYPGESVQANESVLRLVDLDRIVFVGGVEERVAGRLQIGAPGSVLMETEQGEELLQGSVILIAPVTDPASGLAEVRVEMQNPDGRLRAGARARLRVPAP